MLQHLFAKHINSGIDFKRVCYHNTCFLYVVFYIYNFIWIQG